MCAPNVCVRKQESDEKELAFLYLFVGRGTWSWTSLSLSPLSWSLSFFSCVGAQMG